MRRKFTGSACDSGCFFSGGNAAGCGATTNSLFGLFLPTTDDTMHVCNFNCGVRGQCTVRGADGLPVELLSFGVD